MIDGLYDKTSKILFSVYGDDFLKYFGEYKKNYQKYKVHFLLTNSASIINEKKLTICSKPH